jgi:hypothetical protein
LAESPDETQSAVPGPTTEQIAAVQKEMAGLAEGHWAVHSAVWSPGSGKFFLTATANAGAAAIKSCCRFLDDIAAKHLPGINISAAVYFQSGAKIECK